MFITGFSLVIFSRLKFHFARFFLRGIRPKNFRQEILSQSFLVFDVVNPIYLKSSIEMDLIIISFNRESRNSLTDFQKENFFISFGAK